MAIAHRGYSARYPENTMAAFSAAVDLGYRILETDVHATADGMLVTFHDSVLDRLTDHTGRVADLSSHALRKVLVEGKEPIPLFSELLASWPELRFIIDPKEDNAVEPLYQVLKQTRSWDRVCIGSFSGKRLRWLREQAGLKLCTSAGPMEVALLRLASLGVPVPSIAADCVQVPLRRYGVRIVDRSFVSAAAARRLPVQVWTVNEGEVMNWLLDIGVDGIMSDEAELLKDVFMQRDLWHN